MDRYAVNMIASGVWLMVARDTDVGTWHGLLAALCALWVGGCFLIRAERARAAERGT